MSVIGIRVHRLMIVIAVLPTLWAWMSPVLAADSCHPSTSVDAGQVLRFLASEQSGPLRIEARLAQEVQLRLPAGQVAPGARDPSIVLSQTLPVLGQSLNRDVIDETSVRIESGESTTAFVYAGDRRHTMRVQAGQAFDAVGHPIPLVPILFREIPFEIKAGARVRAGNSPGTIVVEKSALLVWRAQSSSPLEAVLARGAQLALTAAEASTNAVEIKPRRAALGGTMTVELRAEGLDLRTMIPAFCFATEVLTASGATEHRVVPAQEVSFVGQSADKGTYAVHLPRLDKASDFLAQGRPWWQRIVGLPMQIRVLGYSQREVVFDVTAPLTLTSYRWSIASGLLVLILLYLISAALMSAWNPVTLIGRLILHSSGRYSLSNLQILLWTVLVVFAMMLHWISSGEVMALSDGILGLLGISAGSSILARGIEAHTTPEAQVTAGAVSPRARDLVVDDTTQTLDLLRFQMLAFTLFAWAYSLVSVLRNEGLPDIPGDLLLLMGISNAAYVGGKLPKIVEPKTDAPATGASAESDVPTAFERGLPRERIVDVQRRLAIAQTGALDQPTRDAVAEYKRSQGIYPATGRINEYLLEKIARTNP